MNEIPNPDSKYYTGLPPTAFEALMKNLSAQGFDVTQTIHARNVTVLVYTNPAGDQFKAELMHGNVAITADLSLESLFIDQIYKAW
jgi:hypothetical protein